MDLVSQAQDSKSGVGWSFPPTGGGTADGGNNGAMDHFAGSRLSSMVREVIQNSLDARKDKESPVQIAICLSRVQRKDFYGFDEIIPHLKECEKMANEQGNIEVENEYKSAIKQTENNVAEVPMLCIHDYNTSGLTGDMNGPKGAYFALVKGAGLSQKPSAGSLGSFGHGSTAAFVFSPTRTVYYFSKIQNGKNPEYRFQGKSILQVHYDPNDSGDGGHKQYMQGGGYYGLKDHNLSGLTDEQVPNWAKELRAKVTEETGTTLFVPFTNFDDTYFPETRISVIANFFYAIYTGNLEVEIDDRLINRTNLKTEFEECKKILHVEQDEIDVEHIRDCFEAADTILSCQEKGTEQIPGIATFDWFLRMQDDDVEADSKHLEKRVGIARNSGMLITRKPTFLQNFNGFKRFDMFVCVTDKDGSDLLKRLENPQHTGFEFDRIRNLDERSAAKNNYRKITKKIREILTKFASIEVKQEEVIDELKHLFSDWSNDVNKGPGKTERGSVLTIQDTGLKTTLSSPLGKGTSKLLTPTDTDQPKQKTKRRNKTKIKRKIGPEEDPGSGDDQTVREVLKGVRVLHDPSNANSAKLFFDNEITGEAKLFISIVGEDARQAVKLMENGAEVDSKTVELAEDREKVDLEFSQPVNEFAIEASIEFVKP